MRKILLLLFTSLLFVSFTSKPAQKVIVAIFAHPDDETAIAQVLAKYAATNKVYLIIATDGRLGTRNGFAAGDSLVKIRQGESTCGCKILGVQPPVFLGFPDGFDTRNGVAKYFEQSNQLKEKLTAKIKELNPDVIITFGPDGDTGHADHRFISDITTEIILKEGWAERFLVYYICWTNKDAEKFKELGLNTVASKYINVNIKYSAQDEEKAMQALNCYKSQLTQKEIEEWQLAEKQDTMNTLHFRQLSVGTKQKVQF